MEAYADYLCKVKILRIDNLTIQRVSDKKKGNQILRGLPPLQHIYEYKILEEGVHFWSYTSNISDSYRKHIEEDMDWQQ